eukprot:7347573-Prymnesium_polylepis.1
MLADWESRPRQQPSEPTAPEPTPTVQSDPAAEIPRVSCPTAWFMDPFWAKVKKLVRPCTAETRR